MRTRHGADRLVQWIGPFEYRLPQITGLTARARAAGIAQARFGIKDPDISPNPDSGPPALRFSVASSATCATGRQWSSIAAVAWGAKERLRPVSGTHVAPPPPAQEVRRVRDARTLHAGSRLQLLWVTDLDRLNGADLKDQKICDRIVAEADVTAPSPCWVPPRERKTHYPGLGILTDGEWSQNRPGDWWHACTHGHIQCRIH